MTCWSFDGHSLWCDYQLPEASALYLCGWGLVWLGWQGSSCACGLVVLDMCLIAPGSLAVLYTHQNLFWGDQGELGPRGAQAETRWGFFVIPRTGLQRGENLR